MFLKTSMRGDNNIGLYGFATDKYALFGTMPDKKVRGALGVKIIASQAMQTDFAGMFIAGNSKGIVVPKILEDYELHEIKKHFDVLVMDSRYTALGNLILMNDHGVILSPLLRKNKKDFERFFGLRCDISTVGGINVVGSAAIATNKGCLIHPRAKKREASLIENVLEVPVSVGTVSFGSHFVRSGVVANSFGFLASKSTSGSELGRITEALGFLEK